MFNTQLHNWLTSGESISLLYSAPFFFGWLASDESAPLLSRCLMNYLHLLSLIS